MTNPARGSDPRESDPLFWSLSHVEHESSRFSQSHRCCGLIGCGGRGSGAIKNCLDADANVVVMAVGDVFKDKADGVAANLSKGNYKDRVDLKDRVFSGLDNFQKVIDSGVDLVILATPPGFRPIHLEAAIKAGKHVFTEKPVAVDAPGIRKVLALVEESKKKGLGVGAGTQRRHQKAYQEVFKFIQDGGLGDVLGGRCAWNNAGIWFNKRADQEKRFGRPISDVEYQIANWYHFNWLCGDHIVEQHVHNLDVVNWFAMQHPVRAVGMGGRMGNHKARPAGDVKEVGNIFDHFAIEFEFAKGFKVSSYCRHYPGPGDVSEMVIGTKGIIKTADKSYYHFIGPDGKVKDLYDAESERAKDKNPYVQEHIDLIASIRNGSPINELQSVTESTFTAIFGKMCAYSGEAMTWDKALASKYDSMPADLRLDMTLAVAPLPVPGVTKFS
jgi:myo-inositol 2-dehydrogenase / D-chiro-inositol 1-dehydrogenase